MPAAALTGGWPLWPDLPAGSGVPRDLPTHIRRQAPGLIFVDGISTFCNQIFFLLLKEANILLNLILVDEMIIFTESPFCKPNLIFFLGISKSYFYWQNLHF